MSNKYIFHFNTRIKVTDRNTLTRENYCVPTTELDNHTKKLILFAQDFFEKNQRYPLLAPERYCNIPNEVFADKEHYTESWVKNHFEACMKNFDFNMNFFNSLDIKDFQKCLSAFKKKNRLKEIYDLNDVSNVEGVYMLVLGKYKQVYIGKSTDIKKRILSHWRAKKEFNRLIYGSVEESILSIDSFGALDTTQIFYQSVSQSDIDRLEEKLIDSFENKYLLNRVAGGLNEENDPVIRNSFLLISMRRRKLFDKNTRRESMIKFVCYPKCTTCKKAEKWLNDNKIEYELRDIKADNPTRAELAEWHSKSGLPLKRFFNTSGLLYKSLDLKTKLPDMTEDEMLDLLATDGMLVKRPILIGDNFVLVGFKENDWADKF